MSRPVRAVALASLLVVAACGTAGAPTTASPPTPASPSTPATPPLVTPGPETGSPPPSDTAPATPIAPPTLTPGETPSPTGCAPFPTVSGPWPSDRLIAVDVGSDGGQDRVIFRFGPPSRPGATSQVSIREVPGPFTNAGSGEPVQVAGSMYTSFRAEGLQLVEANGQPTYPGETDLRPNLPVVKHFVAIDAFEGVMEWIIGTNFACVALETQPAAGTIAIAYSHAVP
jgi:hypothetical protein